MEPQIESEMLVYGMIDCGELVSERGKNLHHESNRRALDELPIVADGEHLPRGMFGISDSKTGMRSQIVHFAASFQDAPGFIDDFRIRFENLLRKMSWFGAVAHLESELLDSEFEMQWLITDAAMDRCLLGHSPKPVDEWEHICSSNEFSEDDEEE